MTMKTKNDQAITETTLMIVGILLLVILAAGLGYITTPSIPIQQDALVAIFSHRC